MRLGKLLWIGFLVSSLFVPGAFAQEKNEIVLGCETSLLPALVWVAENKGYFQKEGLKVTIKEFDAGKLALLAMLNNKGLDMATVAQTPVMFNSFKRSDYAIIAGMVSSDEDVQALARADRGIKTARDLRGKKIGVAKGTTGEYFLYLFLLHNGLSRSNVEAVDLKTSELARAVAEGKVDAIFSWEPHISKAKSLLGGNTLLFPAKGIFREDFYFVPNRIFLKNNPQALKKFLRSCAKAEEFILKNREEAIDIVSKRLKIDRSIIASLWDRFKFRLFLDQSVLMTLEEEARWAIENALTDKKEVPNYLDFIDADILEEVKPKAVKIVR